MRFFHCFLVDGEFDVKRNKAQNFLADASIPLTINNNGAYCNSRKTEISNFFILPISISAQYQPDGQKKGDIYQMELINCSHCIKLTISSENFSNYKWLKSIGGYFFLRKPSEDYRHLLTILNAMWYSCQSNVPFFCKTGFHHVNNHWHYVSSNLTIHSDKLDWGQYMLCDDCHTCRINCSSCPYRLNSSFDGITAPDTENIQSTILSLITALKENIPTALPIFMVNLLASLTSIFSSEGLFTPFILWITGAPGSGKTQLALYLGTFFNKPQKRNDSALTPNFLRANVSTKQFQKRLFQCRDNIVLLDDVKSENSTSLSEHTNTNVDILIRSVFDHNLGGTPIYSSAIVTGEYRPTGSSTLARLLLLPLKSFQESPENLKTLSFFQDNGYLLSDFIIFFLQWICRTLETRNFMPALQTEKRQYVSQYMKKGFSARNSEILTTLKLGLDLLEQFCSSYTPPSFGESINFVTLKGEKYFQSLIKSTAYLHENRSLLYADLLCDIILGDETIVKAAEIRYHGHLNYFNYCVSETEAGLYLENPSVLSTESYFRRPDNCHPILLVRENVLKNFSYALEDYCIRNSIPSAAYKKFKLSDLANEGLLLVAYNRSDGHANHLLKYPSIRVNKSSHIEKTYLDSFYRINLSHPLLEKISLIFSKRHARTIPVFTECTDDEYTSKYTDDEYYGGICKLQCAEDITYQRYTFTFDNCSLKNFLADFENIFNYRHTKN